MASEHSPISVPVQGSFSGTRVVDAKESSVADMAEEHKRKDNEVRKRTIDHSLRARQILRFLKHKHSGLTNHRERAENALEALDPGYALTKKLAEATVATEGEEKWMQSWESTPGNLGGYIKKHVKKWIDKEVDDEQNKDEVGHPNTSDGKAPAAGEGPTESEAETRGGMLQEGEGEGTTTLDSEGMFGGESLIADFSLMGIEDSYSNYLQTPGDAESKVEPLSDTAQLPRKEVAAVAEKPLDLVATPRPWIKDSVPAASRQPEPSGPRHASIHGDGDQEAARRVLAPAPPPLGEVAEPGVWIRDSPESSGARRPTINKGPEAAPPPLSQVAEPGTSTRESVPTASRQPEPDPRGFTNYVSFAVHRATVGGEPEAARRAIASTPPETGIDRDWYKWYRAAAGKDGNSRTSA